MSHRTRIREFPPCLDQEDVDLIVNVESIVTLKRQLGAEESLLEIIHKLLMAVRNAEPPVGGATWEEKQP